MLQSCRTEPTTSTTTDTTVIKNIMYSGGNNRRFEPTVSLTLKDGPTSSSSCAQWFRKHRKYILVSLVTGIILFLSLALGLTLTNATIITSNTPKITTTTMSNTNTVTPTTMPSNTATTTTSTTATTKTTITPGRKRTKFRTSCSFCYDMVVYLCFVSLADSTKK